LIESNYTPVSLLAGRLSVSKIEKKTAEPALSLANNLPANAADRGLAVHAADNGRSRVFRQDHVSGPESRFN
jgi:hypothetical protein